MGGAKGRGSGTERLQALEGLVEGHWVSEFSRIVRDLRYIFRVKSRRMWHIREETGYDAPARACFLNRPALFPIHSHWRHGVPFCETQGGNARADLAGAGTLK